MKIVKTDGFEFCFEDALDAFVFDEKDKNKPTFHGAPMKGVDIIAELPEYYVYVELKACVNPSIYDVRGAATKKEKKSRQDNFNRLKNNLKYKFRDSYLYRHAENKVDKPIHYICLLTFENALSSRMQTSLKRDLPVGKPFPRWERALAESCQVVNLERWRKNFPKWRVIRLTAATNRKA